MAIPFSLRYPSRVSVIAFTDSFHTLTNKTLILFLVFFTHSPSFLRTKNQDFKSEKILLVFFTDSPSLVNNHKQECKSGVNPQKQQYASHLKPSIPHHLTLQANSTQSSPQPPSTPTQAPTSPTAPPSQPSSPRLETRPQASPS